LSTKALLLLFLVTAALAPMNALAAVAEAEAGLVTKVDPPHGRYYLLRRSTGDTRIDRPVVLRDGDEIHVDDRDVRLTLSLIGEKNEVIVDRSKEPYIVHLSPPNESAIWVTWSWFTHELGEREQEAQLTSANIRGGGTELAVHLLDKPQRIAAGYRSIAIAWNKGGDAGITIAIRPLDGKPIATTTTVEHFWTTPALDLKPGFYEFEFRLGPFSSRETRLVEVIDPRGLPRPQVETNFKSAGADLQKTLEAGVLASQSEGAFALEAFQMVSPLATRLPAAKILGDALIDGAWTEKPPP